MKLIIPFLFISSAFSANVVSIKLPKMKKILITATENVSSSCFDLEIKKDFNKKTTFFIHSIPFYQTRRLEKPVEYKTVREIDIDKSLEETLKSGVITKVRGKAKKVLVKNNGSSVQQIPCTYDFQDITKTFEVLVPRFSNEITINGLEYKI